MPELEDDKSGDHPMEESLMDVPQAGAVLSPESPPQWGDDQIEVDGEESLVNIPWVGEPLSQPWVTFEARVHRDEVRYWAAMFAWFRALHHQWERSQKERRDE